MKVLPKPRARTLLAVANSNRESGRRQNPAYTFQGKSTIIKRDNYFLRTGGDVSKPAPQTVLNDQ
jgi:hypothetical protein